LADAGWTAAQIVSELATNVMLHARTDFTVVLSVDERCVRLEVDDASPAALQARQYGATATTGRGLSIVESLSQSWGVTPRSGGKTVWALVPLDDARDHREPRRSAAQTAPSAPTPAPAPAPVSRPGTVARWKAA